MSMAAIWDWLWPWLVGLTFSLVVGHFATAFFLKRLRRALAAEKSSLFDPLRKEVPPWLTGGIERLLFTILVGASVEGFPTAMMAWLALKLASNWNHRDMDNQPEARAFALSALLAGVISMLFAFLGGAARKWLQATLR
jgi:hypothetical protein